METKKLWEEFYKEGKYIMWEAGETTVKFFGRISKEMDIRGKVALDFGCGVGRNSFFMEKIGLFVHAIDISQFALHKAVNKLKMEKIQNLAFHYYDGIEIPFDEDFFDFVISHGVLDHVLFDKARELMKEIHRVLKPNGWLELDIHSIFDSGLKTNTQIDKNTCILEGDCEKGIPQHYFDMEEIFILTKGFNIKRVSIINENLLDTTTFERIGTISMWNLYLQKKEI